MGFDKSKISSLSANDPLDLENGRKRDQGKNPDFLSQEKKSTFSQSAALCNMIFSPSLCKKPPWKIHHFLSHVCLTKDGFTWCFFFAATPWGPDKSAYGCWTFSFIFFFLEKGSFSNHRHRGLWKKREYLDKNAVLRKVPDYGVGESMEEEEGGFSYPISSPSLFHFPAISPWISIRMHLYGY